MRIDRDIRLAELTGVGDDGDQLNVAEMIGFLRAVEDSMIGDPCLVDLAAQVADLRLEIERRRTLAMQVADEIEAEKCQTPN